MRPYSYLHTHKHHAQSVSIPSYYLRVFNGFFAYPIQYVVINIHGGAFMLGASEMVNRDQIKDCLNRGWIVVVPNHRLCPQVNLLEGPMQDCRDLLEWIYDHGLERTIHGHSHPHTCDLEHVFAFGTSSGGHLALSLVSSPSQ